jgi:hypothetical protein
MAERLTKEEIEKRKELARLLYSNDGITVAKELAARVGISEKTVGKWINEEGWKTKRASLVLTKEEQLRRLYDQFTELNDLIVSRPKGQRYSNTKEADILVKLTAAIRQLETETSLTQVIEVLKMLVNFVRTESIEEAKIILKWGDMLIKTLMK